VIHVHDRQSAAYHVRAGSLGQQGNRDATQARKFRRSMLTCLLVPVILLTRCIVMYFCPLLCGGCYRVRVDISYRDCISWLISLFRTCLLGHMSCPRGLTGRQACATQWSTVRREDSPSKHRHSSSRFKPRAGSNGVVSSFQTSALQFSL